MIVEVYDSADARQGTIASVTNWRSSSRLDRAGTFSFPMPATDGKSTLIAAKEVVKIFKIINDTRTQVGAGVIDKDQMSPEGGERGTMLTVAGDNLLRQLTDVSVGFLEISDGSGGGATTALADIMAFAPAGWALATGNPGYATTAATVYANFAGESVLEALTKVAEKTGEHFRIGDGKEVFWLRNDNPDGGVKAIQSQSPEATASATTCLISSLSLNTSSYEIVSRIYPYGAGTGKARLSLETTTESAGAGFTLSTGSNYLQKTSTHTTYGLIERYVAFKDIAPISNTDTDVQTASDVLFAAAENYLNNHDAEIVSYNLRVEDLEAVLEPGETIRVVYRGWVDDYKWIDIDESLYILEVNTEIDEQGIKTVGLVVSNKKIITETDAEIISNNIGETRLFESHPQMSANTDTFFYSAPMDDTYDAENRFWLGAEITNLSQALLRFRIDPLRSTVKSIAGASTTTPSGGSTTSSNGSSATPTSSSTLHSHTLAIANGAEDKSVGMSSLGSQLRNNGATGLVTTTSSGAHTHTTQLSGHTHTTNNHQHTFTPNVSSTYGIFEEAGGNTLVLANLTIKVNSGSDVSGSVTGPTNGWYEVDITSDLQTAATLRPAAVQNDVTFSTGTAKTAQITSQILTRTVIQAIANI